MDSRCKECGVTANGGGSANKNKDTPLNILRELNEYMSYHSGGEMLDECGKPIRK